jgi:undecaprenyl-diphosphatase
MTIIHSIILGIVEGVTEFLPISSTGHLIITSRLLNIANSDFLKSFEIIIQLGAILAVVALYFKSFLNISKLKKIIIGSIPTAIIGFALYGFVKNHLLGSVSVVLWSLFLGGIIIVLFEYFYHNNDLQKEEGIEKITYKQSFFIGVFQSLAIIPGVSRSAATILGGLFLNISRYTIVEFSFLLAVPAMIGASGLDIYKNYSVIFNSNIIFLIVGFVTSFIVAILSIKLLLKFIKKNNFTPFGIYRVIIAVIFFFILLN